MRPNDLVVVVVIMVVIMAAIAMMPRHRSADNGPSTRAHDGADGSSDDRSGGTSDHGSADGVFTSRCAGRGDKCNNEGADEHRKTHGYLPRRVVDPLPTEKTDRQVGRSEDSVLRDITPRPVSSSRDQIAGAPGAPRSA